VIAGHLSH